MIVSAVSPPPRDRFKGKTAGLQSMCADKFMANGTGPTCGKSVSASPGFWQLKSSSVKKYEGSRARWLLVLDSPSAAGVQTCPKSSGGSFFSKNAPRSVKCCKTAAVIRRGIMEIGSGSQGAKSCQRQGSQRTGQAGHTRLKPSQDQVLVSSLSLYSRGASHSVGESQFYPGNL